MKPKMTEQKRPGNRIEKLNHLQAELLRSKSITEASKEITNAVIDIFDADFCRIWLTGKGDLCDSGCMHADITEGPHVCKYREQCLFLIASSGRYTHIDGEVHRRVPFGCYKIGQIAADENRKFITNDVTRDLRVHNREWAAKLGLASFAGYQLRPPGSEAIGVLALFSKHAILPGDDTLLESISNITAQVMQTLHAEEIIKKQNKFLNDVLESLTHPFYVINADDYTIKIANSASQMDNLSEQSTCYQVTHHRDKPCDGFDDPCPLQKVKETKKPVIVEHVHYDKNGNHRTVEIHAYPLFDKEGNVSEMIEYSFDITERKQKEKELRKTQEELIETSRRAGMAEVAADVLHNVGNVLNSVNVSTTLINDALANSEIPNLKKVTDMIEEHLQDLNTFFAQDPKGRYVPSYLIKAAKLLANEQQSMVDKLDALVGDVSHIKTIIKMQQEYAKVSGVEISTTIDRIIEDAIRINLEGLKRHTIRIVRDYAELGEINIDKQRVMQILVNLIGNAKYALAGNEIIDKILKIRTYKQDETHLRIEVTDNGIGISKENLTKIFRHGFTTKKDGHGFGLHSGALAAKEMKGSLTAHSEGFGHGATFTLELPLKPAGAMQWTT